MPSRATIRRRREIITAIRAYHERNAYWPRTIDIARAIDYHGHGLRENHLDAMADRGEIELEAGWMIVEQERE